MKKKTLVIVLFTFTLLSGMIGCSAKDAGHDEKSTKNDAANDIETNTSAASDQKESDKTNTAESVTPDKEELSAPDRATVLAQRAIALEGMSENDVEYLTAVVTKINLRLEFNLMFNEYEKRLSDPNSHTWNYFDQTGEIVIGYSFREEDMKKKEELNLTEEEFEKQYGQEVLYENVYDVDKLCEILNTIKSTIQDKNLIQDFDNAIEYAQNAKNTHDVQYFLDFYRLFHDMDYYLLRYGPEDVSPQVEDTSTIDLFYDMPTCYK